VPALFSETNSLET